MSNTRKPLSDKAKDLALLIDTLESKDPLPSTPQDQIDYLKHIDFIIDTQYDISKGVSWIIADTLSYIKVMTPDHYQELKDTAIHSVLSRSCLCSCSRDRH